MLGAVLFGYFYHKQGILIAVNFMFLGVKYTFYMGILMAAVFGTMIAFGLD